MNKVIGIAITLLVSINVKAQDKWEMGIGIDYVQSTLLNIQKPIQSFESEYPLDKHFNGLSPSIFVKRKLNHNWQLNTGLLYIRQKSQYILEHNPPDDPLYHLDTIRKRLDYFAIPLLVQYTKALNSKSNVYVSTGLVLNYQLSYQSNYTTEIMTDLLFVSKKAKDLVLDARIETGYNYALKNKSKIGINLFLSRNISPYLTKIFSPGFMQNLVPSRYLYGGVGLRYTI